jgi:hypothetical protein
MESNISSGPIFDYNAASDSFPSHGTAQQFLGNSLASVNRDGSLIAMEIDTSVRIMDRNLHLVTTLTNLGGGLVFDPTRNVLYAATSTQIIAYDTTTWTELYRFDIGQTVSSVTAFGTGEMTVSDDGSFLFLSTPGGVRVYTVTGSGGAAAPSALGSSFGTKPAASGGELNAWDFGGPSNPIAGLGSGAPSPALVGSAGGIANAVLAPIDLTLARGVDSGDNDLSALPAAGTHSQAWTDVLGSLTGEIKGVLI